MRVTILGCGTSGGVPRIGDLWGVCDRGNPRNRRRRVSILVEAAGAKVLVDTSPDLREQCLDNGIERLDAVLYTHDHADHVHGIDDLRGFFLLQRRRIPVYASRASLNVLERRFDYVFKPMLGYPAICDAHEIRGPFRVGDLAVTPFEQGHGEVTSLGFRFGAIAYSTDLKSLPESSFATLDGVDVWIVDALRPEPHPTHAHLDLTLSWIERLKPRRAILTHMTADMDYDTLRRTLPPGVEPAYDGMVIEA